MGERPEDLKEVLDNICFGINGDVILFLSYITSNTQILKPILQSISTHMDDWVELDINKNNMKIAEFNMEDGYLKTKELFLENPNIDALFCATDNIAVGAMQYLKECGKKIPEDISIVGFGHTNISKVVEPKLTTVHFHYKTSGIEAANIIMNMIENGDKIIRDIKMGYEIIVQESTN